jgi:hypothetical protein
VKRRTAVRGKRGAGDAGGIGLDIVRTLKASGAALRATEQPIDASTGPPVVGQPLDSIMELLLAPFIPSVHDNRRIQAGSQLGAL